MSLLRRQESMLLGPQQSPSAVLALGQDGLSTARGEARCFIRLTCYVFIRTSDSPIRSPLHCGHLLANGGDTKLPNNSAKNESEKETGLVRLLALGQPAFPGLVAAAF